VSVVLFAWVRAFALTLAVEVPLFAIVTKRVAPPRQRVALAVVANLASHPLVWFAFPELGLGYRAWLGFAEAWALVSEALIYAMLLPTLGIRRAALLSLVANGASLSLGLVLRSLGVDV
jgi:hypothetical protein